jgi:predicted DNA-binding transcriptional regulator YafY
MPAALRSQVAAVHDATVTLATDAESPVDPEVLMTLARACRDHEHVTADYVDRAGSPSQRRLEPYQIVTTGRRWYLLAFDRDRGDWRSLRLDRMAQVRALGSTFTPRAAPDAAEYVRRAISASPYRYVARVRYFAPKDVLAQHFSPTSVVIEPDGPQSCVVVTGADDPRRLALYLAMPGIEFEVLEPADVADGALAMAELLRAGAVRR